MSKYVPYRLRCFVEGSEIPEIDQVVMAYEIWRDDVKNRQGGMGDHVLVIDTSTPEGREKQLIRDGIYRARGPLCSEWERV